MSIANDLISAFNDGYKKGLADAVKSGEWIDYQQGRWVYAKCSLCGTVHDVRSNFCPSCGAEMTNSPHREEKQCTSE